MEDYLKAIYLLQKKQEKVSTSAIAEQLNVSAPSVTSMIRKLTAMGLLNHTSYHGVELTEGGEKIAKEIIRHHRLLELYLVEIMGFTWDKASHIVPITAHFPFFVSPGTGALLTFLHFSNAGIGIGYS